MSENYKIFPLRAQAGIKRDGTKTEGNFWNDGQWTRFYRGLPRSIGGYRSMTQAYPGPSRGLFVNLDGAGFLDIFSGSASNLTVGQFTTGGFGGGVTDITPAAFPASPNNVWQLDSFYNSNGGGYTAILAHGAPNLGNIGSDTATPVYYGDIAAVVPLVAAQTDVPATFSVSGGVCAIPPYAVAYGSNGLVAWSSINDPSTWPIANQANPTSTKIVKGMSIRGNSAPAALLWSLDSLILMSFTGGDTVWSFTTISDQSSILSSSGVVEMDGIYYWLGTDRCLTYNGSLRELPNDMNLDYFFSTLNFAQRQKVFGYKIPHWGEIVWCFPQGNSTECNHAIVYNVRENTWYDTPLSSDGRTAAYFAQSWQYPVLSGATSYLGGINMWQSEFGTDEIVGTTTNAIRSFIETPDLSIIGGGLTIAGNAVLAPEDVWTQAIRFEADFNLGNSLNMYIYGRNFAMDDDTLLDSRTITASANNFDTQAQARYMRWVIESNSQGGYFVMGTPLISYRPGDRNPG